MANVYLRDRFLANRMAPYRQCCFSTPDEEFRQRVHCSSLRVCYDYVTLVIYPTARHSTAPNPFVDDKQRKDTFGTPNQVNKYGRTGLDIGSELLGHGLSTDTWRCQHSQRKQEVENGIRASPSLQIS